jgi:hypothetical protein
MIEIGGLVKDLGRFRENQEAVGEPFGDPEEFQRIRPKVEAGPFAEIGGTGAEIYCDVPNVAGEDTDELSLRSS